MAKKNPMYFNLYVRLNSDPHEFALWAIMQDSRDKSLHIGGICERWPTDFTERNLGRAVAGVLKKFSKQIARLEVRESHTYAEAQAEYAGDVSGACMGDVAARDSY